MSWGIVAGMWYLLCLLLLIWPMRKIPRYPQVSRAALLMAVPWAILVAAMIGQRAHGSFALDLVQAAVAFPLVLVVFWEYGLVFLLFPFALVQYLATGEKLLSSGKWICRQFDDHFRGQPRLAVIFAAATYFPWLLWVFMAAMSPDL